MNIKQYFLFALLLFCTPLASAMDTLSNTVEVEASSSNYPDNLDTVEILVISEADLVMTSSDAPDPVTTGQKLTYNISVTNDGPSNANDVVIDDTLPSGVTFVSATPSAGGTCSTPAVSTTGSVSCTFSGDTAPAGIRTLVLVVKVDLGLPANSTIDNTAETSSNTTDPDPGNNEANNLTDVLLIQVVPTLSTIGLLLLALMMLIAAIVVKRMYKPEYSSDS